MKMKSEVLRKIVRPVNILRRIPWISLFVVIAILLFFIYALNQNRVTPFIDSYNSADISVQESDFLGLQRLAMSPNPKLLSAKWQRIKEEQNRMRMTLDHTHIHLHSLSDAQRKQRPNESENRDPYRSMPIPEVKAAPYKPHHSRRPLPYFPPPGERPAKRFPQAVIIGFQRCGTRALMDFLSIHPYVRTRPGEVHFYDRNLTFGKGFRWYLDQMPQSFSDQITVERTSSYVYSLMARDQIHRLNPATKLVVLLRNPVDRLVSQKIARYGNASTWRSKASKRRLTKEDAESVVVRMGIYHKHLAYWFQKFPWENILIINGDQLVDDPLYVMQKVETFLKIPALYQSRNFVRHDSSGLYCFRGFEVGAKVKCHVRARTWRRPEMIGPDERLAAKFYEPHNNRLFKLLGAVANWTFPEK